MGAGASTLEGVDQIKLQLLQAELNKPKNLSDITEITNVKEEVKKIRVLFNESGLDKVGSEAIKLEAGKPLDCSDINDDGNSELIRLRSLLETLKATSNESSSNFVDAHFPHNSESICCIKEADEHLVWKRLPDFVEPPLEIFPADEPTCNSVKQSAHLGNCYFIATLSALCERKEYIKHLFENNTPEAMKNGRYQCKIYHAGRFHNLNVDDYFPVSTYMVPVKQNGEKNNDENNNEDEKEEKEVQMKEMTSFYFGKNKKNKGLWVPLLEKAYAKIYKSYGAISGGDIGEALRDLTGSPVFSWRLDHKEGKHMVQTGEMWKKICATHQNQDLLCCGYCSSNEVEIQKFNKGQEKIKDGPKIVPNHAYAIVDVSEKGKGVLKLRNPWGHLNSVDGNNNDGCFLMPYDKWNKIFNNVYICALQGYDVNGCDETALNTCKKTFQSRWTNETAGGCSMFPNWRLNPTFALKIFDKNIKTFYLTISQTDKRSSRKKTSSVDEFEKLNYENKIGIEVIVLKENVNGPEVVNGKYNIIKKSSYWNKRDVSIELNITPDMIGQDLIVIPSTYFPNKLGSFSIIGEIEMNKNIDIKKENKFVFERRMFGESGDVQLPMNDETGEIALDNDIETASLKNNDSSNAKFNFAYKFQHEWNDNTTGGPPHGRTFHKNPQYQINVNSKTKLVFLLSQQQKIKMVGKKKQQVQIDKIGIGLSTYQHVECLNNIDTVEKLAAQEKFQIGKPVLMKALEISKVIEVTPEQNPICVVAAVQKGGKAKFILNVLSTQAISIREAPQKPSQRQLDLIKKEVEENTVMGAKKMMKKHNNNHNNNNKHRAKKKPHGKKQSAGPSFMNAKKNMNAMGDLYGNLD